MINKIKDLLTSVRFWIVTLTAIVSVLQGMPVLEVFQAWAAVIVGIGTLDGAASRFAGTKY